MKTKLYFAYGMNTNRDEMAYRCPRAKPIGMAILDDYRLEFKSFATIVPSKDWEDHVQGVLWTITESDEAALDILEGYPEFYQKTQVIVTRNGMEYIAMTYVMTGRETLYPPTLGYYAMVSEGYQQFGLSQRQLLEARSRSIQEITIYE